MSGLLLSLRFPSSVESFVLFHGISIWNGLFGNVVLPEVQKMRPLDRKPVAVGLTRLLTESELMLSNGPLWLVIFPLFIRSSH